MNRRILWSGIVALAVLTLLPTALAHVPRTPEKGESLATAEIVPEPTKSWVIYDELDYGGEARYYRFHLKDGERLRLMLFTSVKDGFVPGIVVMGPGVPNEGQAPAYVELVNDTNIMVAEGEQPEYAEYEPFTPTANYNLVDIDLTVNASGTYYLVIFEPDDGGKFALAIGYVESFTLEEWLGVTTDVIQIHIWEGQNSVLIFAPMIGAIVAGMVFLLIRFKKHQTPQRLYQWFGAIAAFLFFGSAGMTLEQMIIAIARSSFGAGVIVTLIFIIIPVIFGIRVLQKTLNVQEPLGRWTKAKFVIIGVVTLLLWAGLFAGPALLIVAGVLPPGIATKSRTKRFGNDGKCG